MIKVVTRMNVVNDLRKYHEDARVRIGFCAISGSGSS